MTQFTVIIVATVFIATCTAASGAVAPIWMAPKNLNYPEQVNTTFDPDLFFSEAFNADVFENFTASLGEWATIEVATGSRGYRALSAMDSKGIIWILGGSLTEAATLLYTAVWNYNPKTDQYRYVWKSDKSDPFIARDEGEIRVPSLSNHPGGLAYGTAAIDKDDNIWFYSYEYHGELWMFNTSSWMFVRQFGAYDETNSWSGEWPGVMDGHCLVVDSNNDVWMLAGRNILDITYSAWYFNTTSFLWTLVYGGVKPIRTPHSTTLYGGAWMAGCDIDDNDRVWIYGGKGLLDSSNYIDYGDMWTFDTRTTREWEFEYGVGTFYEDPQVVSTDYHPDNRPPPAEGAVLMDRLDGTLMLVPGSSDASSAYGNSNTVWQYSKNLKQWRMVYGDLSADALNTPGKFTNFRAPGSSMPGNFYLTYSAGNHKGDLYLIGGSLALSHSSDFTGIPNRKDIWLIPQDQCSNNLFTCGDNAYCVEEMIGYSCKCKDGYTGDGLYCTVIPPTPPIANVPSTAPVPNSNTPSAKVSSASLVGYSVVSAFIIVLTRAVHFFDHSHYLI